MIKMITVTISTPFASSLWLGPFAGADVTRESGLGCGGEDVGTKTL